MDNKEHKNGYNQEGAQKEQLKKWVEIGLSEDAVAVYGTSEAYLQRVLNRDYIPPQMTEKTPGFQGYLQKLDANGSNIYFTYPFIDRIKNARPDLVGRIVDNYKGWSENIVLNQLAMDKVRRGALFYSQMNAFMHYFSEQTGIRFDNQEAGDDPIIELAFDLVPDETQEAVGRMIARGYGQSYLRENLFSGKDELKERVKREIPSEKLKDILRNTLQQKGVLIYYTGEVLPHAVPGWEDEGELLLVTDQPLALSVIGGIEYAHSD